MCWGVWSEDVGGERAGLFHMKAMNFACGMKRKEACPVTMISFANKQSGTQKLHVFYLLNVSLAVRCTGVA